MDTVGKNNLMRNGPSVPEKCNWHPLGKKEDFRLTDRGLSPEQRESAWKRVHSYLFSYQKTYLGFQGNQNLDCAMIKPFFDISINNGGDPFSALGLSAMNTKIMECAVVNYFANLWKMKQTYSLNDEERAYWGYVASMGCTEANILALHNARDYLAGMSIVNREPDLTTSDREKDNIHQGQSPLRNNGHDTTNASHCTSVNESAASCGRTNSKIIPNSQVLENPNVLAPVVFFSEESYHGNVNALRMLQLKTFCDVGSRKFPCPLKYPDDYPACFNEEILDQNGWPRSVPVEADGSISISCLVKLVTAFVSRGYPPLVIFTSGTTFKGAYDNPQAAINELVPVLKQHNMYERRVYSSEDSTKFEIRNGFWFHIDGAFGGAHLPFLEMAINEGVVEDVFPNGFPVFDFRIPEVKSIAMSLHKWLGCPFPAAVFMIRKIDQVGQCNNPLYIGGHNNTLSCSRNGHNVLIIWDLLSRKSYKDFKEIAVRGEEMVAFSMKELQKLENELSLELWLSRSPGSLFVYFKQPSQDIVRRYSLGSDSLMVKTVSGTFERRLYSHICLMPHVNRELVLGLIEELRAPEAFPIQNLNLSA